MTQLETLRNVIERWEHFCYNYKSTTANGITYPAVLDNISWPHGSAEYIRNKWAEVCDRYSCEGSAAFHPFFMELDSENQQALLSYAYSSH